jgi:hypothetical protein
MATVLAPSAARYTVGAARYDRVFYTGMGVVLGLTVFVAFSPTYYLKFFSGGPTTTVTGAPFTALVHLHGALFTTWACLFIAQTALIATRRVAVHRRVGIVGAVIAAAMVLSAARLAINTAARGEPVDAVPFVLLISLWDLTLFSVFVVAALLLRRDREAHKRLMLLAYIGVAKFALTGRLIGPASGLPMFFGVSLLLVAVPAAYDLLSRRQIHPVYLWGGALILVSMPMRAVISGTSAWLAVTRFLTQ